MLRPVSPASQTPSILFSALPSTEKTKYFVDMVVPSV